MKMRYLGNSGIPIAPIAFGGNVFGWTIDQKRSFELLDAFVDRGFNLIDTANMYSAWVPGHSGGESETIIGAWLERSKKRDQVVLATKVGHLMGDGSRGLKKAYILKSIDESLKRLRTDVIDLYQSHKDDFETPIEETLEAYDTLIRQGKIRAIGASNFSAERLKQSLEASRSNQWPTYVSLQPEYNLFSRSGFESELETICTHENIGVISFYALARGFLSGKYRSKTDHSKSVRGSDIIEKYLNDRGFRILAALDQVAHEHQTVPAVIALAWLLQKPAVTAPIVSATNLAQFSEIATAVDIQLSTPQVSLLENASAY